MHKRCGLVNLDNLVGVRSKTKSFIKAVYVDPINEAKEVIAGYFLIMAKDMKEIIEIGKTESSF